MFEQLLNYAPPRQPGEILAGDVFGRLTAKDSWNRKHSGHKMRLCVCTCGTELYVEERCLKNGNSKSCGCLRKEMARANAVKARAEALRLGGVQRGGDGKFLPKDNRVTTTEGLP